MKTPQKFHIGKKSIRFLSVGCSHGKYADPTALDAVLRARDAWKPEEVIHLGDWADTAAMRKGAAGTSDESEPVRPDIDGGLQFLKDIGATIALDGNHEVRIQHLKSSNNAIVSCCAESVDQHIDEYLAEIKCRRIPYNGVYQKWMLGDVTFTHGTIFNENAARDMAEQYCNGTRRKIVMGHTHRVAIQNARTYHGGTCYNIGTLTSRGALEYAKNRRSTFSWCQAWCWGEYCESLNQSSLQITQRGRGEAWRMPI
jgi:predicted phosphodiesterase